MGVELNAAELARKLADALEAARIPYAIGGAIALGVWGLPRATKDVDLNVFLDVENLGALFVCLTAIGCALDEEQARESARTRGDLVAFHGATRIDVFVPSIPFYDQVRNRTRQAEFLGRPLRVLSPEDLAVFKMLFFRPKDLLDLERLVAIQGGDLDAVYVRRSLVELVGEDDARIGRWEELVRGVAPG